MTSTSQAVIILNGIPGTAAGGLNLTTIDGSWHGNLNSWSSVSGELCHEPLTSQSNNQREGLIGQMVDINALGVTGDLVSLSFDYDVGAGNTLYAHLRGFDETAASPTWSVNTGATNGNAWDTSANGTVYNLYDGNLLPASGSVNSGDAGEAQNLTGTGTFTTTIDLSAYPVNDVGDYEYLMVGFAVNVNGNEEKTTISNFSLQVIPEPSSVVLWGMGCLAALAHRRRRRLVD